MAVTTESFNANGVNRIYTVASTILSESHCRVDYYYEGYDHAIPSDKWDVINNSIVFKDAPPDTYVVKITISTDGEGLTEGPTAVANVAANIDDVVTVADSITDVSNIADNITDINTIADNLPAINTVEDNLPAIVSVAATAGSSLSLGAGIYIGDAVISTDSTIIASANGMSLGPVTIQPTVTVTNNGTWRIL